ncbi:ulp1 protease family, C-terminal catalytic domain-containing protein [Tanacetum coccineum]
MLDEKMSPNVQTFNILVDTFCKDGKIEEAEDAINLMLERGIVPNIVTYSSLLNGYCLQDTHKFFAEMQAQGHAPNERTYAIMLKGLCDNNQMEDALSFILCDNIQHFFYGDLFGDNSVRREVSNQGPPTPDRLPNRVSHASAGPGKRIVKPSSYLLSPYMNERTKVVPKITKLEFIIGNSLFAMQGDKIENIFEAHSENVIDCWGAILNYEERFRDAE